MFCRNYLVVSELQPQLVDYWGLSGSPPTPINLFFFFLRSDRCVLGLPEKNKKTQTLHTTSDISKNTSFLFYAFFFSAYFVFFFVVDSIEFGYSDVKFVGRSSGRFGASMTLKTQADLWWNYDNLKNLTHRFWPFSVFRLSLR